MHPTLTRAVRIRSLAAAALLAASSSALAATDNYIGGAGATNWSTVPNWSLGHAPTANVDTANLLFADASNRTISLDVSSTPTEFNLNQTGAGTLDFNITANTTLSTDVVTVGGAGIGNVTLSNGTIVANEVDLAAAASRMSFFNLENTGKINLSTSGTLKVGDFGPGTFTQSDTSAVNLGTNSTLLIGITHGNGTYLLNGGNITGAANTGSLIVGYSDVGSFIQTSGAVTTATLIVGNFAAGVGNCQLSGGTISTLTFIVGNAGSGSFLQSGGTITAGAMFMGNQLGGNANYTLTFGNLTVTSSLTLASAANVSFNQSGGTCSITNSLVLGSSPGVTGTFNLTGGTLNTTTITVGSNGNGLFIQSGGNVNVSGGLSIGNLVGTGEYDLSGGTVSVTGTLTNTGSFNISGGTVSGAGTFNNNGFLSGHGSLSIASFTNLGLITQHDGNLLVAGSGTFTNAATINLSLPGQLRISSPFANNGTINVNGGALAGGGILQNNGLIAGPGTISESISNNASGTLFIPAGITNFATPSVATAGLIELTDPSAQLLATTLLNSGSIQGLGVINSTLANSGTVEPLGGTLVLAGAVTNNAAGTLRASAGNKLLLLQPLSNNGVLSLTGGTLDNNNQPLSNNNQITGFGTLSTGGAGLINAGTITFTGGLSTINGNVTNNTGQTINIKFNPAIFTGAVTNNANATIKTTSTTVTFGGPFTNNGSFLSDPATNIFQGPMTNTGQISGGPGDVFSLAAFNNSGAFINGGTLNAAGPITNSGTFTQSGPQTWSAAATLANSGTTKFQSNATLAGLTITAGSVDITATTLTVNNTERASLSAYLAAGALLSSTLPANESLALLDNGPNSTRIAPALLGDANLDNHVDLSDLSTLLNHFGAATPLWTDGNFDHQPTIDLTDLSAVLNNFGLTNPSASSQDSPLSPKSPLPTPEPTSLALLVLSILLLFKRRPIRPVPERR